MSWTLAHCLQVYINEANELAPHRDKSSDGTIGDAAHQGRPSDHNRDSRGIVHAVDLTHDPDGGWDAHARLEELRIRQDVRIKYGISNGRIFTSYPVGDRDAWEWGAYTGANPHRKHTHLSCRSGEIYEMNVSPWWEEDLTPEQDQRLKEIWNALYEKRDGKYIEATDEVRDLVLAAVEQAKQEILAEIRGT